jgi:hypothetical protein
VPALAEMRSKLPWPFSTTQPVENAVRLLANGMERRATHIYTPPWLRLLIPSRGALATITPLLTRVTTRRAELAMTDAGAAATRLVGAGGAADAAHRFGLGQAPGTAGNPTVSTTTTLPSQVPAPAAPR